MVKQITVLGATGSIGQNTLAVVKENPELFTVYAVTAQQNVADMVEICHTFKPRFAVMTDAAAARELRDCLQGLATEVRSGSTAMEEVASAAEVDLVMAAIVGAAGLLPTMAAVQAGKRVLLANKEALVMTGQIFMDAVVKHSAELMPVDSEHNAIFQCLPEAVQRQLGQSDLAAAGIRQIMLTGSGGPFRNLPLERLAEQTPDAACAHPNWSMGRKISVDSATMLNKGLEYIEARWLFNCKREQLQVVLHPQSVIHSMVSYNDGSVIAQLGLPDMRTPIAYGMSYPRRIQSGVAALDFTTLGELSFAVAEPARYPCLQLAIDACWQGQWATTTLNAANEIAVAAFLDGRIRFTDIGSIVADLLAKINPQQLNSVPAVLSLDEQVRAYSREQVEQYSLC
ncbi:1-deoxy-D-xylulose-5-phosphate reductoisomerase [Pseudidiomarina sp.]|uniref:1-deoxy-D-xylulose-5-phosphate reductoisomerase n=1 Tax=Pseudidiomarina sp. TaxID=2081707 RepID=UPI00299E30D2|nr:1-deoxy-D-xylulose-5-phosphate reductoisomerase [Pseudidiomarina sp.]MDX1704868.1 1-deoxy-D-xylulose-5-phosphate reductoisomerase [Pseudidiomarina sp.]